MTLLVFLTILALIIIAIRRYAGWAVSRILARRLGCQSVRIGRVGLLYVSRLKLVFKDGIVLDVDFLRLTSSFVNQEYTKPLVITVGDVRLEAAGPRMPLIKRPSSTSSSNNTRSGETLKRALNWLQYMGAVVKTAHVVLLDAAVPDCLFHLTFEQLQLETYRDREGVQLDLSSRLAQAKVLWRDSQHSAALVELSLNCSIALAFYQSSAKLRLITAEMNNPLLCISDGIFDYFNSYASKSPVESLATTPSETETIERQSEDPITVMKNIPNVKLVVDNLSLRFLGSHTEKSTCRTLSASLSKIVLESSQPTGMAVIEFGQIIINDDCVRSNFKCTTFAAQLRLAENVALSVNCLAVEFRLQYPTLVLYQADLAWWLSYTQIRLKNSPILSGGQRDHRFADDFSLGAKREITRRFRLDLSLVAEVTALHCRLKTTDGPDIEMGIQLISCCSDQNLCNLELGIESFWCQRGLQVKQQPVQFEFDRHTWGTALVIGAGLAQFNRNLHRKSLKVQLEEVQFEWEAILMEQVFEFVDTVLPRRTVRSHRSDSWASVTPPPRIEFLVQISVTSLAALFALRKSVFALISLEHLRLDASANEPALTTVMEQLKIGHGAINQLETKLWRDPGDVESAQGANQCGTVDRLMVRYMGQPNRELFVKAETRLQLHWSPILHMIFFEVYQWSKLLLSKQFGHHSRATTEMNQPPLVLGKPRLTISVLSDHPVNLSIALPEDHLLELTVPSIRFQRQQAILATSPRFQLSMDGHPIWTMEHILIQKLPKDAKMDASRVEFRVLETLSNPVWTFSIDQLRLVFPYGYDFAATYDQAINIFKWIKLVHNIKPKPFTVDSPMPADWSIQIKRASLQMNDDPFEVQLQNNYELMVDEVYECERRRQMLSEKLEQLRRTQPLFPKSKMDELQNSLLRKNADIYVERCRKSEPARQLLALWTVDDIQIRALADRSLHGKENVIRQLQNFNRETPYPPDGLDFSTLWCRAVELDLSEWRMQFRDYPTPYVLIKDAHFWGCLLGAEQMAGDRSIRQGHVTLPEPWGTYTVQRNMFPLKFYYDLESEIAESTITYGPSWEPCLSMIALCWNLISLPSRDPSPPMPFWDKMRLLLHGRFSMLCKKMVTAMLASTDPYNANEQVEIQWDNFEFDWTSGQFCVQTDVNAFVRTASKYDDIRVLHLPSFKWSAQLNWQCMGDPNDHHSVVPCAPGKLPEYSTNQEHDSFRAFRSTHLDLVLNLEVKSVPPGASDSQCPQILLYANTFRWLDFLMNTLTMVNRPVKRGPLFGNPTLKKMQLGRHYKHLQVNVSLPRFIISYWMSFSSSYGFRMISSGLHLTSAVQLQITPSAQQDGVQRRRITSWAVNHMSAQLLEAQIHLFGDNCTPSNDLFASNERDKSFFVGLSRMAYDRESTPPNTDTCRVGVSIDLAEALLPAVHRLTVHDLRASWTIENRDTCMAIADGANKARILRKILSHDALKQIQFVDETERNSGRLLSIRNSQSLTPGGGHLQAVHQQQQKCRSQFGSAEGGMLASEMLQKLIDEADTNFLAYSEETTELPSDSLHGVALCGTDDVVMSNWQIDLLNSQAVLKGCETDGFVIVTAARASVTQRMHAPVWRKTELLGKRSWTAVLSGMQYFAPLVINRTGSGTNKEQFRWLSRDVIEERSCSDPNLGDKLDNYIGTGEAVGGVVAERDSEKTDRQQLQLQRVVSRCSAQLYFCYFSDTLDIDSHLHLPPAPPESGADEQWGKRDNVDCLTLRHNMLEVSTNPQQYEMLIDIINHLVLFVDPKKQETEERRQRLRFACQVKSLEDIRESIFTMQNDLRDVVATVRSKERQAFFLHRQLSETPNDEKLKTADEDLTREIDQQKQLQISLSEKLAMTISCFNEHQVTAFRQNAAAQAGDGGQAEALVARRFEVCFEDCTWRLTENDGQIAIADMQIRNFLYTRTARINNAGDHLLEVGNVKATNLIPNAKYRDTLQVQDHVQANAKRLPVIRIICRDMAPVGGISVKEHFEVNIAPMVAQITYKLFEKMMAYFFPGRNIDKEDQQNLDTNDETSSQGSLSRLSERLKAVHSSFRRNEQQAKVIRDEIDKMKERAQKNNMFVYIKIPEVPFIVSYKGSKEKNIEDVDRFQLIFPLCEYHDRNWTWLDLSLAIKQRCKRVLLHQFMKHKLLRNRLMGLEQTPDENMDEEEKKRIVLGATTLGEKDKKKKKK